MKYNDLIKLKALMTEFNEAFNEPTYLPNTLKANEDSIQQRIDSVLAIEYRNNANVLFQWERKAIDLTLEASRIAEILRRHNVMESISNDADRDNVLQFVEKYREKITTEGIVSIFNELFSLLIRDGYPDSRAREIAIDDVSQALAIPRADVISAIKAD